MLTCANGHQNPENQPFCGECGSSTQTSVAICPNGHTVPLRQKFCGQCGAPAASPLAGSTQSSSGRWTTDPYDRHQYRYWDGSKWTAHVGDVGSLGIHRGLTDLERVRDGGLPGVDGAAPRHREHTRGKRGHQGAMINMPRHREAY